MLKQVMTLSSIMDNKLNLTRKGIFLYNLPILVSAILEEMMILTDTVLLSFKEPVFLATVGVIDSLYLLFLSMGESLNDTFQNYYARHIECRNAVGQVFKYSLLVFIITSLFFCLVIFLAIYIVQPEWIGIEHYNIINSSIIYLCGLTFVTYISLALNSLLMGLGKTKELGAISILSVIINFALGYFLLFKCETNINPCAVILLSSITAEVVAISIMSYVIWWENKKDSFCLLNNSHRKKIITILIESALYLCATDLLFHIGSLCLYLYCLYYFDDYDTAIFTLLMSYWGIIQVPAQSFSETSLNVFSYIHSINMEKQYRNLRSIILKFSASISILFGLCILLFDQIIYDYNGLKLLSIFLIIILALLNSRMEIKSVSLISKLKNNSYLIARVLYGFLSLMFIIVFTVLFENHYVYIFFAFILSIIVCNFYLNIQERKAWRL